MARPLPKEPWFPVAVTVPESVGARLVVQAEGAGVRPARLARDYISAMVALADSAVEPIAEYWVERAAGVDHT